MEAHLDTLGKPLRVSADVRQGLKTISKFGIERVLADAGNGGRER